jgi:type IV pilus assembly protein PilO
MNVIQELQRVNWQNPGTLSNAARAVLGVGILIVIGLIGWYVFIAEKITERDNMVVEENNLFVQFQDRQQKAANLEPLQEQLATMEAMLEQMLKQLPSKTQLSDLLVNVSQEALSAGIQVRLFQPQTEILKDFYAERPILLRMVGDYNQFAKFVSGVATLPRVVILTMHDIALTPADKIEGAAPNALVLEGTVKTYRYLDEEETAAANAPKGPVTATAAPVK